MNVSLRGIRYIANGYSRKVQDIHEKRKSPRFPVKKPVFCFRYGRKMTMRTMNISLEGLKLKANFDLRVGEPMVIDILTNSTRIPHRGRILPIEDIENKAHARLCFAHTSDMDFRNLSDYLSTLSRGKGILLKKGGCGLLILLAYIVYLLIHTYFFQ